MGEFYTMLKNKVNLDIPSHIFLLLSLFLILLIYSSSVLLFYCEKTFHFFIRLTNGVWVVGAMMFLVFKNAAIARPIAASCHRDINVLCRKKSYSLLSNRSTHYFALYALLHIALTATDFKGINYAFF